MRLIDGDALEKFLSDAEKEATKRKKYVFASALNVIQGNVRNFPTIDPEPHWIPCSERMPDEHEWLGTKRFGTTISDEVYVTFENPKGERFCKHLSFQNKKLSDYDQHTIDAFYKGSKPIAWQPLPEPYQPDGFTKWVKGVADSYRNDKEESE